MDNTATFTLPIGSFNPLIDVVTVIYKGSECEKNLNYIIVSSTITLINGFVLNKDESILIRILKAVINNTPPTQIDISNIPDGLITKVKLATDVQNTLDSVGNLSSNSISESTLAEAVKNDRTSISNIGNNFLAKTGGTVSGTISSTVTTGTAPLVVTSTTKVTNLNSDYLDGYTSGNANGNIPINNGNININLNAEMINGKKFSDLSSLFAPSGYGLGTLAQRLTTGIDLNSITSNGYYSVQNPTNGVTGLTWHNLHVFCSHDNNYVTQSVYAMSENTPNTYMRSKVNGIWGNWVKIVNNNDFSTTFTGTFPNNDANISSGTLYLPNGFMLNYGYKYVTTGTITNAYFVNPFPNRAIIGIVGIFHDYVSSTWTSGIYFQTLTTTYIGLGTITNSQHATYFALGY